MQFLVSPDVFDRFLGIQLAIIVAEGIDNRNMPTEIVAQYSLLSSKEDL